MGMRHKIYSIVGYHGRKNSFHLFVTTYCSSIENVILAANHLSFIKRKYDWIGVCNNFKKGSYPEEFYYKTKGVQ